MSTVSLITYNTMNVGQDSVMSSMPIANRQLYAFNISLVVNSINPKSILKHKSNLLCSRRLTVPLFLLTGQLTPIPALGQLDLIYTTSTHRACSFLNIPIWNRGGLCYVRNAFIGYVPNILNSPSGQYQDIWLFVPQAPNVDIRRQWRREKWACLRTAESSLGQASGDRLSHFRHHLVTWPLHQMGSKG